MRVRFSLVVLFALILAFMIGAAGCGMQGALKKPLPDDRIGQKDEPIQINLDLAGKVKETARSIRGVKDSAAVVINREISVGIKVSGLHRLRLKQIKNEAKEKIKGLHKNYNIYMTSDKKLLAHQGIPKAGYGDGGAGRGNRLSISRKKSAG